MSQTVQCMIKGVDRSALYTGDSGRTAHAWDSRSLTMRHVTLRTRVRLCHVLSILVQPPVGAVGVPAAERYHRQQRNEHIAWWLQAHHTMAQPYRITHR